MNIQPITVPECNLHEDIGSLLFKQILTDVTLVVVSNANQSSDCKCQTPFSLIHGSSNGGSNVGSNDNGNSGNNTTTGSASSIVTNTTAHVLARADMNKKYSRFDRGGTDDDADDGDGDLDEEEQEDIEETEDFDEDDEVDDDDPDQEQEGEEREDDSQVYRSSRVSCASTDEAVHISLHHHSHHSHHHQQTQYQQQSQQQQPQQQTPSDRGESEATPRCSETPNALGVGTGTNEHAPSNTYMNSNSGIHLAPTSTTIPIMTKGVPTGTASPGRYTCANASAMEGNIFKPLIDTSNPPNSVSGTTVGANPTSGSVDWLFTPSSSNFTQPVQPSPPPTEDHEASRAGTEISCDMCGSNSLTPLKLGKYA